MNEKDVAQDRISRSHELIGIYKHYKGGIYTLYSITIHEETLETMVHYYSHLKKSRWSRSFHNFFDPSVDGVSVARFEKMREASHVELLEASVPFFMPSLAADLLAKL